MLDRPLYQPTPTEMQAACETLLRSAMPREARRVVREIYENLERNNGTENHQSI